MAPSPALSAQSEDDLFSFPKRPSGYETIETIPINRITDSPELDNLASLPPLPQSQYAQSQPARMPGSSQYITQPTQIINRSPGNATPTDISSPPPRHPIVQVAASSPMTAPSSRPVQQHGVLGRAMNMMAPAGTQLRRPPAPQRQPSPTAPELPPQRKPTDTSWFPDEPLDSSDSDRIEQERNRIKPRTFVKSGAPTQPFTNRPPPTGSTFSAIVSEFGYQPGNTQLAKRPADTMASSYGNIQKRPRQVGPARAMPIPPIGDSDRGPHEVDDIMDPNIRAKVKRMQGVCTTNTVKECYQALMVRNANFDDAVDYLLLQSESKDKHRQQHVNQTIVLPSSDDELMMTPAKWPKGVAVSTQAPSLPSQQTRRAPVKSIAQKYTQPQQIAPASVRRLDAFDTPPPQDTKKRTLMRGRKNRSPSPASKAANAKKAIVLDDSGDEVDSGVQSEPEDAKFDSRVLNLFNTCTPLELCDITGVPKDVAEHFVSQRPFKSIQAIFNVQNPKNKKPAKRNVNSSFGEKTWDKVYEMMKSYEAVDYVVKKCENMSKPLARSMGNWGVDVYGKGKDSAGLDLVSIPHGNSQDSSGKDSGIGTPISDDGKQLSKKAFIAQPASLAEGVQMKDYQVVGLNWLCLLFRQNLNGILADDMGLGKTLQTIAFIAHLAEVGETGPHLIVVPSATLENWLKEFARFAPGLDVRPYYGSIPEREQMRADYEATRDRLNVIVTTYQLAKAKDDNPWLRRFGFTCAIFDEGHQLKNPTSEVSTKLTRIHSKFRLLLTGTPLQNNLTELMGLLKFLMPSLFAEREDDLQAIFKQSISVTTEASSDSRAMLLSKQRIDRARSMLTPFILRRKKWQVLKDLPKKTRHVEFCDMSSQQSEIYAQQLAKAWDVRERKAAGERIPPDETANILMRLRQAAIHPLLFRYFYSDKTLRRIAKTCPRIEQFSQSNPELIMTELVAYADFETYDLCSKHTLLHPYLLSADKWETSGKVIKLLELLAKFKVEGHRTLVFSQFVMVLDILSIILRNHDINFLRLDGSTRVDERQDLIDLFNAPAEDGQDHEYECFMLSTKAGGAGINLTGASRVIVFDSGFNPQDDVQAENRCHRIGQLKDVEIYRLVTKDSVEEQIYEMGKVKLQLDREVAGEEGQAVDIMPSGVATPAEMDDEIAAGGKKGRGKKGENILSSKEVEGAALIEDMLFKKLEEDSKTPAKLAAAASSQSASQKEKATSIKLKLNAPNHNPKHNDIRSLDGSADSPLTELSSSDSDEDLKPLTKRQIKKERDGSSDVEVVDITAAGRGQRKAAAKASANLKDPFDDEEVKGSSQRSGRSARMKKEKEDKGSQSTISRSGRLVRGRKA